MNSENQKQNGMNLKQCLSVCGCSKSNYYNHINNLEEIRQKEYEESIIEQDYMKKFKEIIQKIGHIPGKNGFRQYMWRDYNINICNNKCKKIMNKMHLVAAMPKKDAYKNQATHFHECVAEFNHVQQDFKIGPRRIILTDITYLYYSKSRSVCYLCTFKDAFTNEILGYDVSTRMNVELVKAAYKMMMEEHKNEFSKDVEVYIHSDQGSQYLSTEFKRILKDDGFIQSMSNRGNSQDNAPQESFFGRMKTALIDLIAMCPDVDTVKRLIKGYLDNYNNERYQYSLAGLTPHEYYLYSITGIYPLDNYYGVKANEMMSLEELVSTKQANAKEKAEKRRKASQKKREERNKIDPAHIIARDQKIIRTKIKEQEHMAELVNEQIKGLNELLEKTKTATDYYHNASNEIKETLKDPMKWRDYPELSYVMEMGDWF